MKNKKKCQKCGSSDHMVKMIDPQYNIVSTRFRICFQCEEELQDKDLGDLVYFDHDVDLTEDSKQRDV